MSPKAKKRQHDKEITEEAKSGRLAEEITIVDVEMTDEEENKTLTKILEKQNDEKVLLRQQIRYLTGWSVLKTFSSPIGPRCTSSLTT